jgi:hypothetical protein
MNLCHTAYIHIFTSSLDSDVNEGQHILSKIFFSKLVRSAYSKMEERPSIWRVAVNKLNKQPRTADEGWSSSFGVGRGANNSSP